MKSGGPDSLEEGISLELAIASERARDSASALEAEGRLERQSFERFALFGKSKTVLGARDSERAGAR